MVKTKIIPNDDNNDCNNEENNQKNEIIQEKRNTSDAVVNVEILDCNDKNNYILRFDLVSIESNRGSYKSRMYEIGKKCKTNGLFDLLDDFYSNKFYFFSSSKTTQAFMLALQKTENDFYKKICFDFKEYVNTIKMYSMEATKKEPMFKNPLESKIKDGYGITDESLFYYRKKNELLKIGNHIGWITDSVVRYFKKYLNEIEKKHFCAFCINNTDKIPPSFFIDPTVNLPMLFYHEDFFTQFAKKVVNPYLSSRIFKLAEISEMKLDLWVLMPDSKINDLLSIVGKDGELKCNYDTDFDMKNDFVIGKYKTLKISSKSKVNDEHETVVGFNY